MKKRLVSILLALCMALSLLPVAAWAIEFTEDGVEGKSENIPSPENNMSTVDIMPLEDTLTYGNLTYKIENGEITITGCTSSSPKNVAIPAEIDGIPVTSIGNQAFFMKSVSNLTIPSSIISIGDNAFNMCFDLTSVTIPNSVTKIGDGAFANNHLTSVTIPSSVTSLGGSVFFGCKELTNVTIPNSVTSISRGMFAQCSSLTSVNVPNGVTNIGEEAFSDCHSLTSITIPTSVTSIGEYAFNGCTGLTSMTIPNSVTNIGPRAFSDCTGLTDVSISNNISSIAEGMFLNCTRLTSVTIPKGITNIGGAAFSDCTSLTSVIIPDSVTSIGDYAFNQCFALEDVYFAGNAEQWKEIDISVATMKSYDGDGNLIGVSSNDPIFTATIHYNSTGPGESLDSKTISGVLRQGDGCRVLWQCSYQVGEDGQPQNANVKIFTSSTDTVPEELFLYNESAENGFPFPWELEPYSIPGSAVTTLSIQGEPAKQLHIPSRAFQGYDHLGQVVLNGVSGIDSYAFEGCAALQSVGFSSDTLKSIGASAFANCSALATIKLDRSVATIGDGAFSGCSSVKIRCYTDSAAHQYALENDIPFELIDVVEGGVVHDFEYGRDTFQFANTKSDFYGPWGSTELWWKNDRTITGDYYDILFDGLEESERQRVKDYMKEPWDGSCFGMSCVLSLVWADDLDVSFFQGNAKYLHDLSYPKDSETIFNLINYYHLIQKTNRTANARSNYNATSETSNNRAIITALDSSAYPVVVGFLGFPTNGTPWGHAVVAYGYERSGGDYLVSIWDPKDKNAPNTLRISSDFTTSTFARNYDTNSTTSYIKYALTVENGHYDYKNIQSKLMERGYSSMGGRSATYLFDAYTLSTNYNSFTISNGAVAAVIVDGTKVSGDLEISNGDYLNEMDQPMWVQFALPEAAVYTITDISGAVDEYRTAVSCNGADGFYSAVTAADSGVFTFSADGSVETEFTSATEQSVTVVRNDVTTPWYASTAKGITTGMTVVPSSTTTQISCKDQAEVTLTVEDDYNTASLPAVSIGTEPATLCEDSNKDAIVVFDDNSTVASVALGHSLIFYTFGGTPIEAQANIPVGGFAQVPAEPVRYGFTFGGWYMDSDCQVGHEWSFNTPIIEDTRIYAKWTPNSADPSDPTPSNPGITTPSGSGYNPSDTYTPPTYSITTPSATGGKVSVNPTSALSGSTVTVTVTPDVGYELAALTVSGVSGKILKHTDKGNGQYSFKMPNEKVLLNVEFRLIGTSTPWGNPFADIDQGAWYYDAVKFVNQNGLMNGIGGGTFAPNANLSRAMFAQILYNKEGRPNVLSSNVFNDVSNGLWYTNAIMWASEKKIVDGYGGGMFGPDDPVTREQLAVMLWRYAGKPVPPDLLLTFTDANRVSDYALDALRWAIGQGIIKGKGNNILDPKGFATRAEVAQILKNYLEK